MEPKKIIAVLLLCCGAYFMGLTMSIDGAVNNGSLLETRSDSLSNENIGKELHAIKEQQTLTQQATEALSKLVKGFKQEQSKTQQATESLTEMVKSFKQEQSQTQQATGSLTEMVKGLRGSIDAYQVATKTSNDAIINKVAAREPRLGDDCLLVYLDVGSNIGVHNRFLFEPNVYPKASKALSIFTQQFGDNRDNRDICAFGFEPNPNHKERHLELEEKYAAMGWRYKYIGAGVGDQAGNLTFYHQGDTGYKEWGFSTSKRTENSVAQVVPVIDFQEWVHFHILERRLPDKVYGNYASLDVSKGRVVMKMDIEGYEYIVLPSLLYTGEFCKAFDFVFGELHPRFVATKFGRDPIGPHGQGELELTSKNDANAFGVYVFGKGLKSVHPSKCKAQWMLLDDESYLTDGMPWPTPQGTP